MKQVGIIFCLAYIIVFIVLKLWEKPNMEFFYNYQATKKDIERFVGDDESSGSTSTGTSSSGSTSTGTSSSGSTSTGTSSSGSTSGNSSTGTSQLHFSDIAEEKLLFEQQQKIQAKQNEEISRLKKIIDQYRNDLIIIRNKDKDEINNILGDSITQATSMNGGDNDFNKVAGKIYNLNFDLDEE